MSISLKGGVRLAVLVGAVLGAAGCGDPWSDAPGGQVQILRVGAGRRAAETFVEAPEANGTWLVPGVATISSSTGRPLTQMIINIQTNRLLDGASIQTAPNDCTPVAGGLTVTATPASPAGATWYTCYNPTAPNTDQAGSIWIYAGTDKADPRTGLMDPSATYHVTGQVKDEGGAVLPIDVTVTTAAAPAPAALQ